MSPYIGIRRWLPRPQIAPLGVLAVLFAALLSAVPANAESTSAVGTPTSATQAEENTAPVEINLAPVEPPETNGATTEATAGDIPAVAEKATSVAGVDSEAVADASSSATRQTKNIVSSVPPASEAGSVPEDSTSLAQPDTLVGSGVDKLQQNALPQRQLTTAVEQAGRNFKTAVERVGRGSAGTIAATTKRLTTPVTELDLLSPLFDSMPPLSLPPLVAAEVRRFGAAPRLTARIEGSSRLRRHGGLLPSTAAIDPRVLLGEYLVDTSLSGIANVPGSTPKNWEVDLSPGLPGAETTFAGPSDERSANPPRPDLPPQAPQSPATAVGSSGGSSFVPVVALLALLALVAPTARRRLGEAADFRAPTPFVCALERPG